jgi:hypothetical protein
MPTGGARNRSGPPPDPNSLKSAKRGLSLTALPSQGYDGDVPDFPLPNSTPRDLELWAWAWSTPQAAAWAVERWRWQTVAMWVRTMAVCESLEATAADKNSLHRFADQIGLTPAGLKENGWKITADEVGARRTERPAAAASSTRDRLKAVRSASAAG